jgi:hypothetical protein
MEVEAKTDQRAADRPAKTVVAAVAAWLIKVAVGRREIRPPRI